MFRASSCGGSPTLPMTKKSPEVDAERPANRSLSCRGVFLRTVEAVDAGRSGGRIEMGSARPGDLSSHEAVPPRSRCSSIHESDRDEQPVLFGTSWRLHPPNSSPGPPPSLMASRSNVPNLAQLVKSDRGRILRPRPRSLATPVPESRLSSSTLANRFMERDWPVLAIKGDLLDPSVSTEDGAPGAISVWLQPPSVLLRQLARSHPVLLRPRSVGRARWLPRPQDRTPERAAQPGSPARRNRERSHRPLFPDL